MGIQESSKDGVATFLVTKKDEKCFDVIDDFLWQIMLESGLVVPSSYSVHFSKFPARMPSLQPFVDKFFKTRSLGGSYAPVYTYTVRCLHLLFSMSLPTAAYVMLYAAYIY